MLNGPILPDFGIYHVWPERGVEAFHPEDRNKIDGWIPSDLVFERFDWDGKYYHVRYADRVILRIEPILWLEIPDEGLRIGDQVEVLSNNMQNDPMVAQIVDMRFSQIQNAIEYTLEHSEMRIEKQYLVHQLVRLTQRENLRPRDVPAPQPKFLGQGDLPAQGID
ncbi:MAG: DUF6960 family protein [Pirellula sp.]